MMTSSACCKCSNVLQSQSQPSQSHCPSCSVSLIAKCCAHLLCLCLQSGNYQCCLPVLCCSRGCLHLQCGNSVMTISCGLCISTCTCVELCVHPSQTLIMRTTGKGTALMPVLCFRNKSIIKCTATGVGKSRHHDHAIGAYVPKQILCFIQEALHGSSQHALCACSLVHTCWTSSHT